jgi:hypothetical protein
MEQVFTTKASKNSFFSLALVIQLTVLIPSSSHDFPSQLRRPPSRILPVKFKEVLDSRGLRFDLQDDLCARILADFGAIFAAHSRVLAPPTYMFPDADAVSRWQSSLPASGDDSAEYPVTLQSEALKQLQAAQVEAHLEGLAISPASHEASIRNYQDTVDLWLSRIRPGVAHWVSTGRLDEAQANHLLSLTPRDQVSEVLRLEESGIFFSKDFSKSILYSVAAPGTSQHLSLLALDIREHNNTKVRLILSRHGWFQTVYSDLPHFTFLDRSEAELPSLGLVARTAGDRTFWIVNATKTRGRPSGEHDVVDVCPF